ncbi:MAG TPA: hypothetical protein VIM04_13550 [Candidatus Binatia bacterium]|jgi:hypothetical protein
MKLNIGKLGGTMFLVALGTVWGCESVSLIGRESIEPGYEQRSDIERRGDYDRRDRFGRDTAQNHIYGTVQDIDERRREIRLRTDDGRTAVVRYDSSTRFFDGSRDIEVASVRTGDSVSIQLERNAGGEQYANAIRVEDRRGSWTR